VGATAAARYGVPWDEAADLEVLQISGVGPLELSQQFETQRETSSSKVIYVEGGLLCSFVFKVT